MRFYVQLALLSISLFITSMYTSNAQTLSNVVDLIQPDKSKLEWLTFVEVNKLRAKRRLSNLVWDDVLYRAAIDHAQYLILEDDLSHYQTTKGKKTPTERVKIHGGLVYTVFGENIVEITLGGEVTSKGITLSTVTYEAAANVMAALWKSSPGHYKNIISKNYNCTALAIAYNKNLQRLIAVQVFGFTNTPSTPEKLPDFSNYLLSLPTKKLPYKLKPSNQKNQKSAEAFSQLSFDRGYITGTYKSAKKIFKGRRSGISQEFIPLSQFDSASTEFSMVPNRRNALFELNGKLSKPIYRKQLLKYSRKRTVPTYYIKTKYIRLFKKPPLYFVYPLYTNEPETEFNIFLVKNKCLETYRTYSNIPSKLLETPFPSIEFKKPFKAQIEPDRYKIHVTYDTLRLKLFYTSGQIVLDSAQKATTTTAFNSIKGKITAVEIAAFASIEGNKESNEKLAKARMENFMTLVNPYLDTISIEPKFINQEQWRLFYKQIEKTRFQFLRKTKPDDIRTYVNVHISDTLLIHFLNEQRYLNVSLIYKQEYQEKFQTKTPIEKFDSLMIEFEKCEKPSQGLLSALEKAQLSVYNKWALTDSIHHDSLALDVPNREKYPIFKYNQLMFEYTILGSVSDIHFYNKIHELGTSKYFPSSVKNDLIYNNLVLIYRSFISDDDLNKLISYNSIDNNNYRKEVFYLKKQKNKNRKNKKYTTLYPKEYFVLKELPSFISSGKKVQVPDFSENELWKYYYVYTIHSLYGFVPMHAEINKMLPGIKKYYHPNDAILTDSQRLELGYFYSAIKKYDIAKNLIKPIATRSDPNIEALKFYLTLMIDEFETQHEFENYLTSQFSRLGKKEWCDLWINPNYLNFLLLEDLKLKEFYNCNCDR